MSTVAHPGSRVLHPIALCRRSLARAVRHWRLALVLYLPGLVLGSLSALPVMLAASSLAPTGPWLERVLDGDFVPLVVELMAATSWGELDSEPLQRVRAAGSGLVLGVLLVALAVPLHGLLYAVLSGGVLAQLADPSESFWVACRRRAWSMIRLSVLGCVLMPLLGGVGAGVGAVLLSDLSPEWAIVAVTVWFLLLNSVFELARAHLALGNTSSAVGATGRAFQVLIRPRLLASAGLAWLLLVLAGSAQFGLLSGSLFGIPATALLPALVAHQAVAFVGAWIKLARLSVAVELASETPPVPTFESPGPAFSAR